VNRSFGGLTDDEVIARSAYDTLAAEYAKAFPDLSAETQADRDLIASFYERVPQEGHVLDLGCGTGRVTADLRDRGLLVAGMDVSRGMLVEARRRDPQVPVVVGSLLNLSFGHGTAGGVLAWCSVIHTAPEGLPAVVAEMARVLRSGAHCLTAFQSGTGERVE
jgi:SAM-dependent methyltransferase